MNVTIKDVARVAGVSVASVSRALNGHENVTRDTRQRIVDVANRLRYMPNNAARSLITRRTQTIGAVLPDLHGEFFSELIRGMDAAARVRGLHLLVSSAHGSAAEAADVLRTLRGRVDGMLIMSPHADANLLDNNLPAALPVVLMNTRIAGGRYPSLSIDNHGGAFAVMRHLVECGHRRIACIAGPVDNLDAAERLRGYRDALAQLLPNQSPLVFAGDFTEHSGHRAAQRIRELDMRPDAIFAANDTMAIGCLFALNERGVRVPEDIALAGFDDIPLARFLPSPLTTVRVHIAEFGRLALERLAARLDDSAIDEPDPPPLDCEIVVRASCGAHVLKQIADTTKAA